jgi:hypothetical protein
MRHAWDAGGLATHHAPLAGAASGAFRRQGDRVPARRRACHRASDSASGRVRTGKAGWQTTAASNPHAWTVR